jgi:hypothetical protein
VSSQDHFDAGWEREIRPMMGEGRVMQEALFYGFSLAGACTTPHALLERRYSVGTSYADIPLTSDGRTPNCARKRLLKWDEPVEPHRVRDFCDRLRRATG